MYDNEHEEITLSSIRSYLWNEKSGMTEIFSDHKDQEIANSPLHNFAKGFGGGGDHVPATYAQQCMDYEKKHQKDATVQTVANCSAFLDEMGNLTLQQDRNHIMISSQYVNGFRDMINALTPTPDAPVVDINTQNMVPGSSTSPKTNAQLSQSQNEAVLAYRRNMKFRRGY